MNRRLLLGRGLGAVAVAIVSGRAIAGNVLTAHEPLCDKERCRLFLEPTTRQNIEETKTWKHYALRERGDPYSLFTFYGCCRCEAIPPDAKRTEWTFKRRNLTTGERESFHYEYGQQASFLLCTDMESGMRIRGFILNGRKAGWNLSTCGSRRGAT